MAVFGAEQIQKSKITSRYFDKYIVSANIGSIIATVVIPYIQKDASLYFTGYIVAASLLLVGALLFSIGYRYYIHIELYETVITKCIPVVINAFQTRHKYKQTKRPIEKNQTDSSPKYLLNSLQSANNLEESLRADEQSLTFLDYAKAANQGKFTDRIVNDVKSLRTALVVFFLLIPYWLIYHQAR
jgi:dipeptide/tripeptide permease